MRSPELPALAALTLFSVLLTLHTQIRMRNVPVLVTGIAITVSGTVYLVNTLVWAGNVRDVVRIWCDVVTNLWLSGSYFAGCASLCTCIRLEWITSSRTSASAYNRTLFEVVFCCLVPLLSIPLRYVASMNRYMILEDFGCVPAIHPSKIAITIAFGPLFPLAFLIFIFCSKTIFNLLRRAYASDPDALTRAHFSRMLGLCIVLGIYCPFIVSLIFYRSISLAILPWPGFASVHRHFPRILRIPLVFQPPALREMQVWFFWSYISSACIFVGILASGKELRRDNERACAFLMRTLITRREGSHHKITSLASNDGSRLSRDMPTLNKIPIILIGSNYTDEERRESCSTSS